MREKRKNIKRDKTIVREIIEVPECTYHDDLIYASPPVVTIGSGESRQETSKKGEEVVRMGVYEMIANAYNTIFDECMDLRGKYNKLLLQHAKLMKHRETLQSEILEKDLEIQRLQEENKKH